VTCARAHLNKISAMTTVYDFTAQDITGATIPLRTYQGKVFLIVNTASKCGFAPQYEGLQRLQKDLADRGFAVLGFPCNQFGHQEPGDAVEIASFCKLPLFSKIDVDGSTPTLCSSGSKRRRRGSSAASRSSGTSPSSWSTARAAW
jgi:glutathione peroxidase